MDLVVMLIIGGFKDVSSQRWKSLGENAISTEQKSHKMQSLMCNVHLMEYEGGNKRKCE